MSLHPDDQAAYISFLEEQVDQARAIMACLLDYADMDYPPYSSVNAPLRARMWLDGTFWN